MKPTEHKISDASFTGHYFKLLVIRLKQFKTAKHVVLIMIVLVCILARYVVLSADKEQSKDQSVTQKYQKAKVRVAKPTSSGVVVQQNNFVNFSEIRFNSAKTDVKYFLLDEKQ